MTGLWSCSIWFYIENLSVSCAADSQNETCSRARHLKEVLPCAVASRQLKGPIMSVDASLIIFECNIKTDIFFCLENGKKNKNRCSTDHFQVAKMSVTSLSPHYFMFCLSLGEFDRGKQEFNRTWHLLNLIFIQCWRWHEDLTCDHAGGDERKHQALQHSQQQLPRKSEVFFISGRHVGGSQRKAKAEASEKQHKGQHEEGFARKKYRHTRLT